MAESMADSEQGSNNAESGRPDYEPITTRSSRDFAARYVAAFHDAVASGEFSL
jgi:hypothetical protein